MKSKQNIRQIIPAPDNLYVIYETNTYEGKLYAKVVCLALCESGDVDPMYVSHNGIIERAEAEGDSMKVVHGEKIPEDAEELGKST